MVQARPAPGGVDDATVGLSEAAGWIAPHRGQNRSSSERTARQREHPAIGEAYSRTIALSISRVRPAKTAIARSTSPSITEIGCSLTVSTAVT